MASLLQSATGIVHAVTGVANDSVIDTSLERLPIDISDREKIVANVAARFDDTLELAKSLRL